MKQRPRVVHLTTVHHAYDPRILQREARSLAEGGYEVHLLARHEKAEEWEGVRIHPLPQVSGRMRRLLLQREALRKAIALKADIYHFHDPELIPLGAYLKKKTRARVIYDIHEEYWQRGVEGKIIAFLERWALHWLDGVVSAHPSVHERVQQYAPQLPAVCIMNYPLIHARCPVESRSMHPLRLIYTGVMARRRGLMRLLALMREAKALGKDWQLILAGVGYLLEDLQEAEAFIAREGLTDCVIRYGWDEYLAYRHIESLLCEAHVGVYLSEPYPNILQSIPTKFYEFLHAGLPMVVSDFPHWRAFVEELGCGVVISPEDTQGIIARLSEWQEHPARYNEIATRARKASEKFRWSIMEERLLDFYARLLHAEK